MLIESGFWKGPIIVCPGIGGQSAVFPKIENVTMELIGSAFSDHQHFAAADVAKLSIRVAGDYSHLLNRKRRRIVASIIINRFVDVDAVQNIAVGLLAVAIERRGNRGRLRSAQAQKSLVE